MDNSKILCNFAQDLFNAMLQLSKRLNESEVSREELLSRVGICKTKPTDCIEIIRILVDCFKIPSIDEAIMFLLKMKISLTESVKLIDTKTNEIYGLLLFGNVHMKDASPLPFLYDSLSRLIDSMNQVCGVGFIIDERLRGCGFDKKMLYFNQDFLKDFDLVWCGVDKDLDTYNYWKRLGFFDVLNVPNTWFLAKFI